MIWPTPVKRWYVANVGRISWERPWRWPSSSDLCLRPNSDINPLIRLAFAFCYVPKQRCREHWHKVWFVNSPFNYWIFSARKQVFCIIDQYMTFWEWFLVSHCNSNGYIAQKKMIILFVWGLLLTWDQCIWTAFWAIFSGIPYLTIFRVWRATFVLPQACSIFHLPFSIFLILGLLQAGEKYWHEHHFICCDCGVRIRGDSKAGKWFFVKWFSAATGKLIFLPLLIFSTLVWVRRALHVLWIYPKHAR